MSSPTQKKSGYDIPPRDQGAGKEINMDARARLELLREGLAPKHEPAPASAPPPTAVKWVAYHRCRKAIGQSSKLMKTAICVAAVMILGWTPAQRLMATTSAEAVINGRVTTVRAPIAGKIQAGGDSLQIGSMLSRDAEIATISNPRADRSHLDNLKRGRGELITIAATLESKLDVLARIHEELADQKERFRLGRIQQLEQRISEVDSEIASATARQEEAIPALERARALRASGTVTQAGLDKAIKDASVAKQAVAGLIERRKGMLVEIEAARNGTFLGDSYNDTPQSAQRALEVELELADTQSRLEGARTQIASLETDIAKESRRLQEISEVSLQSSVHGRVWEVMVTPGEYVNAGQDLLRILECGSPLVMASVSERTYQSLFVGQKATFKPRNGDVPIDGSVIGMNGLAAVNSSSAIQQSALTREPYYVMLRFPALAHRPDCDVGRAGVVTFMSSSPSFLSRGLKAVGLR